jgi:hypothetical protein
LLIYHYCGITHFVKNPFVEIHKDDEKLVVDHFVKNSMGFWHFLPMNTNVCVGSPEVLGDERKD